MNEFNFDELLEEMPVIGTKTSCYVSTEVREAVFQLITSTRMSVDYNGQEYYGGIFGFIQKWVEKCINQREIDFREGRAAGGLRKAYVLTHPILFKKLLDWAKHTDILVTKDEKAIFDSSIPLSIPEYKSKLAFHSFFPSSTNS